MSTKKTEEFDSFAAPVTGGTMPRWQRKALEASQTNVNRDVTRAPVQRKTPARSNPLTKSNKRPKTPCGDRFIPCRSAMDMDRCRLMLNFDHGKENGSQASIPPGMSPSRAAELEARHARQTAGYSSVLAAQLFDEPMPSLTDLENSTACDKMNNKILAFREKAPAPKEGYINTNRVLYAQNSCGPGVRKNKFRQIPQAPEKILDAPGLMEDFYLNLVDWGSSNTLAVALAETVYLWNANDGSISQLCETSGLDDCITSVSWTAEGNHLAVGTNRHEVQIWDAERMTCVRKMRSHSGRVGALAWNNHILSTGSRDAQIHNHDVRIADHHVATLASHTQEVCGLKWSPNGTQLASGGNDNLVCVWDNQQVGARWTPKYTFDHHQAAVKALAWCPWQNNLLATGGGTADRHLRFWNTSAGTCVNSIDTKSQVCSIVWSQNDKELVTSHGFSQNQLTVWKYPTLARMAELKGHTSRVLHTSLSPDGQTVVSGAADETLRFWKVFASDSGKSSRSGYVGKGELPASSRSLKRGVNIR